MFYFLRIKFIFSFLLMKLVGRRDKYFYGMDLYWILIDRSKECNFCFFLVE